MDLPEVGPASNHALHRSEVVRWSTFPDLKLNSMLHALSCSTPLFAFPHLPRNDILSKLRMGQDLLAHLSCSYTDRVNHAVSVSAISPIWQSACKRLAHGMGHGIRRAQQFDERSNSLAPPRFFSPCLSWAVAEPLARFRHSPLLKKDIIFSLIPHSA